MHLKSFILREFSILTTVTTCKPPEVQCQGHRDLTKYIWHTHSSLKASVRDEDVPRDLSVLISLRNKEPNLWELAELKCWGKAHQLPAAVPYKKEEKLQVELKKITAVCLQLLAVFTSLLQLLQDPTKQSGSLLAFVFILNFYSCVQLQWEQRAKLKVWKFLSSCTLSQTSQPTFSLLLEICFWRHPL